MTSTVSRPFVSAVVTALVLAVVGVGGGLSTSKPGELPVAISVATISERDAEVQRPRLPTWWTSENTPQVPTAAGTHPPDRKVGGFRISSLFGPRRLPWEARSRFHRGVDLAAPAGTPVQALADGVVVSAGRRSGYGLSVTLRHRNGMMSSYSHLKSISPALRRGASVVRDEQIGQVGSTGHSTGPHLHLEIHTPRGVPIDPVAYMRSWSPNSILFGVNRGTQATAVGPVTGTAEVLILSSPDKQSNSLVLRNQAMTAREQQGPSLRYRDGRPSPEVVATESSNTLRTRNQ